MFVWLASYPKSGNTLVRSMIAAYFFSQDGNYNFELIKNIKQFPNIGLFEKMGIDITKEKEVLKNYIRVQETFNKKDATQFLKTHSYLFNIDNNPFTDLNNTLGVIYVVRDPRNVVTSVANHMSISKEEATRIMIEEFKFGGDISSKNSDRTRVYMGTWAGNYNSWKSLKEHSKYLLIKYEDLISNRDFAFRKILKFLHKIKDTKFKIDQEKFKNVIESTDFSIMKNLEKKSGFDEAKTNPKTGKKVPFFNLGPKNDWKKILPDELKIKIEKHFKKEMKELGYL
ncbi:sulfotransferase domain-containing protein [Candidatus Pelagibacter sp.]|uniref:sulfotransferase domain-containing protein n=1 Tax=Candidatus Pelagibacter sp. TaxID=2024849 RepID=UPI003F840D93